MNSSNDKYLSMANAIRILSADAIERANSGHPGMPLGMADIATILFSEFLKFNPLDPKWPNRDRFILSNGHGSMLLYAILYFTGYKDFSLDTLKSFRKLGSIAAGHPEKELSDAIETSTGPLGQGLANGVGMAIAERIMASKFGSNIVDHYTYVFVGDGCLMEGISLEAASLAGHLNLSKLIVLFDDNDISIDGPTNLATSDDHIARFAAQKWHTQKIDGHNYGQIREAIKEARNSNMPSIIACKTKIGYGAPNKEGKASAHGAALGKEEIEGLRKKLGWNLPPFEFPAEIMDLWQQIGLKNIEEYNTWVNSDKPKEYVDMIKEVFPNNWENRMQELKKDFTKSNEESTRKSSGKVIESLFKDFPNLIGGSADLTGSNNTKTSVQIPINKNNFSGNYIHYGVREHAMAAIMNGLALYKGLIPYGGTFLVFSDYCRPAIRLAALMGLRVIYVMTHDSIGVGEDGPTHQPVEHLASLRAVPNLNVYRPADATETIECWTLSIKNLDTPSVLVLTRQDVPRIRDEYIEDNLSSKGAYIIAEYNKKFEVTIFASGSEVHIALQAKKRLEDSYNIGVRIVSVPCHELFFKQDIGYINQLLCNTTIKVAIEAAIRQGWERFIGPHGIFIGMDGFGQSAPAEELYKYYEITSENLVNTILAKLARN
jgi:transketolase